MTICVRCLHEGCCSGESDRVDECGLFRADVTKCVSEGGPMGTRGPKCVICEKPVGSGGEFLFFTPHDMEVGKWLCGRKPCADKYNDEPAPVPSGRAKVLEVIDGVPIVEKVKQRPAFAPGDMFEESRGVWRVESVRESGIDVRCVAGRGKGKSSTWSCAIAGVRRVTADELEARKVKEAATVATDEDENCCPNCWPDFGDMPADGVRCREDMGRDPSCPNHVVKEGGEMKTKKTTKTATKKAPKVIVKASKAAKADAPPKVKGERPVDPWAAIDKAAKAKGFKYSGPGYRAELAKFCTANGITCPEIKRNRAPVVPLAADQIPVTK